MKKITLTNSLWFKGHPEYVRRQLLRNMFELADVKGWAIRVGGEHYSE